MSGNNGTKRPVPADEAERRETRRRVDSELTENLRRLDAPGALAKLESLCRDWQLDQQAATFEEQLMGMFHRFGLNYRDNLVGALAVDRGSFGLREVDDRINEAELQAIGLYHRLHHLGLMPESTDCADETKRATLRRSLAVIEAVFYAKRVVLSAFQHKLAVHQLHLEDGDLDLAPDLDARLGVWALRFRYIDASKTTPFQTLLLYLMDAAMEKRYRKYGGWMYEPIHVDGRNTHAWRPVVEIKDFVYANLRKETSWEQWCNATSAGLKNITNAVDYLTNCNDYQLPKLVKQRGVYAFPNGVYIAPDDAFHPFDETTRPLSEDVVACKYVPHPFDRDAAALEDWRAIPTPALQSIFDYQGFEPVVCDWLYALLGRMLYELRERDGWQVVPYLLGAAASGKCESLGTPILMADGSIKKVEDVAVGDLVMGEDSKPRRVLTLARGVDEMYELRPKRKHYPTRTVTREHVLCLKYTNQGSMASWKEYEGGKRVCFLDPVTFAPRARKFRTTADAEAFRATLDRDQTFEMTVARYLELPEYMRRYLVAYRVAVEFPPRPAPTMDPWAIGVWLGDGTAACTQITNGDAEVVAGLAAVAERVEGLAFNKQSADLRYSFTGTARGNGESGSELGEEGVVRARKPSLTPGPVSTLAGKNPFLEALKGYDLLGNKHIPDDYKLGSRETRAAVLAGLLDTDGYTDPRSPGCYEITQKSQRLADDIVFVARSLGLAATRKEVTKWCMHEGTRREGQYVLINIFGDGTEDLPMRVERKKFPPRGGTQKNALRYGYKEVVSVGNQDYYGFETDGDHRYLLGDFTVTHNSTVTLEVCKRFFDAQDVGVLSNNIERKFGISGLADKYMWVAPEVKNDLGLEQAEFQSMVSGEDVSVAAKFQVARSQRWTAPGIMAGNEVPGFSDNGGSMGRRMVVVEFGRTVVDGDMKLGEKLEAELPRILLKVNRAYLEKSGRYGSVNIWTALPPYFHRLRDQFSQTTNSLEAFLASDGVRVHRDAYCPSQEFFAALKAFEMQRNIRGGKKYDKDFTRGPFSKHGIRSERAVLTWNGQTKRRDYLFGVDLIADDAHHHEGDSAYCGGGGRGGPGGGNDNNPLA